MSVSVQSISVEQVRPLRHKVLRPNQDYSCTLYPLDLHEQTFHAGVILNQKLVAVASLYHEDQEGLLVTGSWRIRGMAVEPHLQKQGYGQMALQACVDHARQQGASQVWCNARTTAAGFYKKFGFKPKGSEFVIEGIGPHYVLELWLGE